MHNTCNHFAMQMNRQRVANWQKVPKGFTKRNFETNIAKKLCEKK